MKVEDKGDWEKASTWCVLAGAIAFGLLGSVFIARPLFPHVRGEPVRYAQAVCAGLCGGVGAWIGHLVGSRIDRKKG